MRPRAAPLPLLFCTVAALLASVAAASPAAAQASTSHVVPGVDSLLGVWCGPDGVCLGVGSTPADVGAVVVLRANGSIGPVQPAPGTVMLMDIDCAPGGGCVAVGRGPTGDGVVVEVRRDGTPGPARPVSGSTALSDVACATATTCLATGQLVLWPPLAPAATTTPVFTVITNGQPGSARELPRRAPRFVGIDCLSATRCLAVGSQGVVVFTSAGGAWTTTLQRFPGTFPASVPADQVSCASSTTCYATAYDQRGVPAMVAVSAEGVVGPVQGLTDQWGIATSISCAYGRTCTVVGQSHPAPPAGLIIDVFRGSPAAPILVTDAEIFTGVSCIAGATCGIVGSRGQTGVFRWHGPVPS